MRPKNQADRDAQELQDAHDVLAEAGERWLETKAAGRDTSSIDVEVAAAERTIARLETKVHRR